MKTINVVAAVIRRIDETGMPVIFATQRGYGEYKDWWEFPGGKIEQNERPEEALVREIKEELATDIIVEDFIQKIEYDYPEFHLSMDCFWCSIKSGKLTLLEHESAKWLSKEDLMSVNWLPADIKLIKTIEEKLGN